MGEKKEGAKNEGEKKPAAADAGATKDDGSLTVVLKTDMHCEGCAKKIKRAVKNFQDGVCSQQSDCDRESGPRRAERETGTEDQEEGRSHFSSAQKDGGGDKKPAAAEEKAEKKPEEKKPAEKKTEEKKPKEAPKESTVVMKMRLHCEGCMQKMKSKISKFKGVNTVSFDAPKDIVTVKGFMDAQELVPYLREKFRRSVEVVPPKKDDGAAAKPKDAAAGGEKKEKDGGGEKKDKEAAAGGGEKKELVAAAPGGGAPKVEVNKMEYSGYPYPPPSYYWYDEGHVYNHNKFVMEAQAHQAHVSQGSSSHGYAVPTEHYPAPQMFSDENPNGCSVM
ncbi:Heavy metal transport/detoxification superfamily protein [Prunus dulcis]|uniref:Heavy metal transport/detoxification superfamily protein n=1 Tax=Prunus dulcis TaxID=3755 RepID=A0A4Y1RNN2_PRUDU|nr:Heavy metal transport/detoxification superfamily protein [Prunus dulcis]